MILNTRLIEGQFPNYRQLLPESYEHDVRLPRSEFLEVTKRISQLAQRNAPLKLSLSPGELTVAAETPEVGDASESMPAAFEGEPLEIGFNPEFLKDGIDSVEGEEVLLRLISPLRPGPAAAGGQRGLPLPGDADPPQRLSWADAGSASVTAQPLRSLDGVEVALERGVTAVLGENGAGKTNLLEALYFALTGRSFRTADRRELIPFSESLARAEASVRDEDGTEHGASWPRSAERRAGGICSTAAPVDAATAARNRPAVAVFAPDRLALVKGPPAERRAHLDRFIAIRWPSRAGLRQRFGQALAQRNALLHRVGFRPRVRRRARLLGLDAWPRPQRR